MTLSRTAVERQFLESHPGQDFDEAWHELDRTTRFAVEPYGQTIAEMRELYREHWEEIAIDKDAIALEPDYESYADMDARGILHLVTARASGALVGYHLSMIRGHLHYKSSITCFTDIFYLKPAYRVGMTGYRMLKFFRDSVKSRGVQKIYMGTKLAHDIGPLLERLGFKPIERLYTMVLP